MNYLKRHQQPHLTKVTFYSSSNFANTPQIILKETTLKLGRNDFKLGRNRDFELGRNDLGRNRLGAKRPVF